MNPINIYLSLLGVILLAACSISMADTNNESKGAASAGATPFEVITENEHEKLEAYEISIHYPQTPNDQIDQSVIDYVNQVKDYFKKKSYEAAKDEMHSLKVDYDVLHEDERLFVVKFTEVIDVGTKQKEETIAILNFDKNKGKRLDLNNIFSVDRAIYTKELMQVISEEAGLTFPSTLEGGGKMNPEKESPLLENLALKGDKVEIHFSKTQQKEYALDKESVEIDKSAIKEMMHSKYAENRISWLADQ
ncbi:hypothetical protein [Halobacillus sp. Marseille-Q1614]|uniref:hypothetical protein n=1 Tax=Halobacillus sp. Marseille-Q1614 TaxID=2709134 RepID=UPI001570A524|nr:hypothetical protein [Halobacillus sp. Marseille-Q1614]